MPVIVGPTAGYLFAYPLAALVVGSLAERGWDRSLWRVGLAMLAGEVVMYAVGLPWLAFYTGPEAAVVQGLLPFIPGDLLKLGVAAAVLPSAWGLLTLTGHARNGSPR